MHIEEKVTDLLLGANEIDDRVREHVHMPAGYPDDARDLALVFALTHGTELITGARLNSHEQPAREHS